MPKKRAIQPWERGQPFTAKLVQHPLKLLGYEPVAFARA